MLPRGNASFTPREPLPSPLPPPHSRGGPMAGRPSGAGRPKWPGVHGRGIGARSAPMCSRWRCVPVGESTSNRFGRNGMGRGERSSQALEAGARGFDVKICLIESVAILVQLMVQLVHCLCILCADCFSLTHHLWLTLCGPWLKSQQFDCFSSCVSCRMVQKE